MKQVLKIKEVNENSVSFFLPDDEEMKRKVLRILSESLDSFGCLVCEFDKIRKKISTGKKSQNSHIWGHITQIARETGNDIDDVELTAKVRAVKMGYPVKTSTMGNGLLLKHINNLDSKEAAILIESLHNLAAEFNICLIESENEGYF